MITCRGRRVVVLVVLSVLVAGCTTRETKGQYEQKVTAVYQLRQKTISGMQSNGVDDARYFASAKSQIDKAVASLQAISPPKDVQQAHDEYIQSLQAMSSVLGQFAHCATLGTRDPTAGESCRSAISQSTLDATQNDFQDAEQIYQQAGYHLPQVAGSQ